MRHPHDGRSYSRRSGRPFYGWALKAVLTPHPEVSYIERLTLWWESLSLAQAGVVIAAVILAVLFAALIVTR